MARVVFTITQNAVTVILDNRPKVVPSSSPNYAPLAAELRKGSHNVELIRTLADVYAFVAVASHGEVQIARGEVRWRGNPVRNVVAERILDLLQAGHDLTPLANFLDRVMQNPLTTAQNELFLWLEAGSQPITPEGKILAYKIVRRDYKDIYTGTIDNSVGQKPWMPREYVDADRSRTCSVGLHFAAFDYLSHYHTAPDNHIMILLVDPADVVAIPNDYSNQKGRTWTYEVIGEVAQDRAETFFAKSPLVDVYPDVAEDEGFEEDDDGDEAEGDEAEGDEAEGDEAEGDESEQVPASNAAQLAAHSGDIVWGRSVAVFSDNDQDAEIERLRVEAGVPTPVLTPAPADKLFTRRSGESAQSYLGSQIIDLVSKHGQRGAAKLTGIARTTIQEWLKVINRPAGT